MNTPIQFLPTNRSTNLEFDWGRLTWFAGRPLGNSEDMTIGRCILKPGMANPRHYHPNCSEILVVVRGRILHTLSDKETVEMGEGDTVTIPANNWHCARNLGNEEAVLFIAFSSADRETIGE